MAEKKFSDLTTASQINETDIAAISQESNGVWGSFKATIGAIGQKIITGINFANAFNTNAKTVAGAVNEKLTANAVADIEVSPAESAHSEGDYLIYNGLLYLVIDDIAIGDALTTGAGGNIEIAQIADGIGGAGHDILNDAGSTLPKEGKLQFVGVYVHDDSINGKTVVENYREMTAAEYSQLTAEQKKGLINVTDEQGHPITASATGFDNTGTSFEGDNVQEVLEEVDNKLNGVINPPDLSNVTRESLTSGTFTEITSTGKWYCVTAENQQTSGSCMAYLLDSTYTYYLSATQTPDGDWKRATTSWLYFPAGAKFYVRAIFTYAGNLCSAPCL